MVIVHGLNHLIMGKDLDFEKCSTDNASLLIKSLQEVVVMKTLRFMDWSTAFFYFVASTVFFFAIVDVSLFIGV